MGDKAVRNQYIEFAEGEKYPTPEKRITYDLDELSTAGYVIKQDEVIIDIDCLSQEAIEELIKRFNIKTEVRVTDRGVHLYFKKPRGFRAPPEGVTALGFKVEYKVKDKAHWIKIKDRGVERIVYNEGIRAIMPDILRPYAKYQDLNGLSNGDGRNKAMHKHKFSIAHFPEKDLMLDYINNYIFDEPLEDKEFTVVTRKEKTTTPEDQQVELAKQIIQEHGLVCYNKEFYIKNDKGNYDKIDQDNLKQLIVEYAGNALSKTIEEIFKQIGYRCEIVQENHKPFPIKFKNGFLVDGEFHDFNFTSFTPYHIDIEYIEDAEPVKAVDDYLDFISHNDPNYRKLLEEMIGYCFNTKPSFNQFFSKFFILYGTGSNGKGTFLRVIERILGSKNCSFLSHAQLGEHFGLDNMIGKLANISDDIPDKPFNDQILKMIKNISSSDPVQIDKKNKQPLEEVVLTTTLLMSSNHYIKSFEKGESYKRRVVWLPVDRQPEKKDPHLIDKLTTPKALEYWVSLAIKGYFRLCENEDFTNSEIIENFNKEYHYDNDNTLEFCSQLPTAAIVGKKQGEMKALYDAWCEENDEKPLSKKSLTQTLQKCGFEFVKTGRLRVWQQRKPGIRYDPYTNKKIIEDMTATQ